MTKRELVQAIRQKSGYNRVLARLLVLSLALVALGVAAGGSFTW